MAKKWAPQAIGEQARSNGRATAVHHHGGGKRGSFQGPVGDRFQGHSRLRDPLALAHTDRTRHDRERLGEGGNEGRRQRDPRRGRLRHDAEQTRASVHVHFGLLGFCQFRRAFDIHYVDANGKEIPPDTALAKNK
jgi:hypothetical protein